MPRSVVPVPGRAELDARPRYASCGTQAPSQGVKPLQDPGLACLNRHLAAHTGGEYVVTELTTEGDPVTTYYRVTPHQHFEIWVDSSQDQFSGSRGVTHGDCGVRTTLTALRC